MAIPEERHHTIRTLHSMGFSQRAISASTGIPLSTLHRYFWNIVGEDTVGGELKVRHFKNAALCTLAIEDDTTKGKVAALNALDVAGSDEEATTTTTTVTTTKVRDEILDDLRSE